MISKEEVKHLASLARIELTEAEETKLQHDLAAMFDHFEELKEINTDTVEPMAGGSVLTNQFRNDEDATNRVANSAALKAFPESASGLLKVPPVFSSEGGSAAGRE